MTGWWNLAVKTYHRVWAAADPRVEGWFMMDSPIPAFLLTIVYVFLVEYALPKYMEDKKPYSLKRVMIVYNFSMVALSGYIFYEFGMAGWLTTYTLGCQMSDFSTSPQSLRMMNVCWLFYISKFIEFIDTIIFSLRKKTNQVSFLHVVHHAAMGISWYFSVKFSGGGMGTFHAFLNSFIHFMMYTYYGLASLGPKYRKYLWWKKYLTKMQMIQFILCAIHTSQLYITDCEYSYIYRDIILFYAIFFLVMFSNFYIHVYIKKDKVKHKSEFTNGNTVVTNGVHSVNGVNGLKKSL